MFFRAAVTLTVLSGLMLAGQVSADIVPLPQLENRTANLRVAHAVNPRLPKLTKSELATMLAEMQRTMADHFDIRVVVDEPVEVDVHQLLSAIPDRAIKVRGEVIYDFKTGTGNRDRLRTGYDKTLREWRTPVNDLVAYAKPHLVEPVRHKTFRGLAEALTNTHLRRLEDWQKKIAADGKPVLDETNANEWAIWDLLGYSGMPFDLIVTNQPVISAEYDDGGLNSALRGGVSAGSTSYSKTGRYGTYAFISTFPFTEYEDLPAKATDITSRQQAVNLAGKYTAHEVGHMLLLLGHPFRNRACVMRPEPLFRFAKWARNLNAEKCRIGSSHPMTPGAAKIGFNPDW